MLTRFPPISMFWQPSNRKWGKAKMLLWLQWGLKVLSILGFTSSSVGSGQEACFYNWPLLALSFWPASTKAWNEIGMLFLTSLIMEHRGEPSFLPTWYFRAVYWWISPPAAWTLSWPLCVLGTSSSETVTVPEKRKHLSGSGKRRHLKVIRLLPFAGVYCAVSVQVSWCMRKETCINHFPIMLFN